MIFKREVGALVNSQRQILHITDGEPGHTDFPPELVWQLHQQSPGIIYAFVHIHPPSVTQASGLDEELISGWAKALYPFPIRITVIAQIEQGHPDPLEIPFKETCWLANFESKEEWINRGKQGVRKLEIIKEWERIYWYKLPDKYVFKDRDYIATLLERAYLDIDTQREK